MENNARTVQKKVRWLNLRSGIHLIGKLCIYFNSWFNTLRIKKLILTDKSLWYLAYKAFQTVSLYFSGLYVY